MLFNYRFIINFIFLVTKTVYDKSFYYTILSLKGYEIFAIANLSILNLIIEKYTYRTIKILNQLFPHTFGDIFQMFSFAGIITSRPCKTT